MKISIIVALYNAESTLCRMLDSLKSQTFSDFEVVVVNDGSTDASGTIADDYAATDSRVKVYHKENGGVSSARQLGLDIASGKYVIHVDPDDYVEPNMLQDLYNKAEEEQADIIICDFFINTPVRESYESQKPSSLDADIVQQEFFQHLHGSCWNKLVRLDLVRQSGAVFPLGLSYCEDLYFNVSLLNMPNVKIGYLPNAYYHYVRCNGGSNLSSKYSKEIDLDKDLLLIQVLSCLVEGKSAYNICMQNLSTAVVERAFRSRQYSAVEFIKYFQHLFPYLRMDRSGDKIVYLLMIVSVNYSYSVGICIYKLYMHIRSIIKSLVVKVKNI